MRKILNFNNYAKINEKLANIDDDVNMLYDIFFKEDVDEIERTGKISKGMFKIDTLYTGLLESDLCKKANALNPSRIEVNRGSNYYKPGEIEDGERKGRSLINISVNSHALNWVFDCDGDLKDAIFYLDSPYERENLANEFKEERIKGSIHHELAHWIDDSLHNNHLQKMLSKVVAKKKSFKVPVTSTKIEIEGQIHNIKQLYNKYKDNWDRMTFDEMINLNPPLRSVKRSLPDGIKEKWIRDIKTRMHREGLLGKRMVNI